MRWPLFYLFAILPIGVQAGASDTARIATRYGIIEVTEHPDTVDIRFRGKVVHSVKALGASLYRVTSNSQREFVVVDALTPGLHCHHVFLLVEMYADGKAIASNPVGTCKELRSVEFNGDVPRSRLGEPDIPERRQSMKLTDFEWRDGRIVQVLGGGGT
jgi:hypothetical protein